MNGTGLDVYTASGVSDGKATFGSSSSTLGDFATGGLSIYDADGVTGGKAVFGSSDISMADFANGAFINNASNVDDTTTNFYDNLSATFYGSQDTENLGSGDTLSSGGNADQLLGGGSGTSLSVYGKDNNIDVSDSSVTIYGTDTGDTQGGSGDSYSFEGDGGDGDGTYGGGGDGFGGDGDGGDGTGDGGDGLGGDGDGSGDGDGGGGGGDGEQQQVVRAGPRSAARVTSAPVTTGQAHAASSNGATLQTATTAAAAAAAAGTAASEGPKWSGDVVTYAFSSASGQPLSTAEQAAVEQAFGTWAQASGLVFQQVSGPTKADIAIGFASPGTLSSGVLGQTTYASTTDALNDNVFSSGSLIQLAGPNQAALAAGVGGALTYAGGQAQLYQVALTEIGHALGLSDDSDPDSIMYSGGLGTANPQLDATDVADVRQLYGQVQGTGDADTYTYNPGAGSVVINQLDTAADPNNVLKFASGITPGQVSVSADPDGDILLTLSGGGQVTLADELDSTPGQTYGVQAVDFADGTSWSYADLLAKTAASLPASTGFTADLGQLVQSIASFEAASPTSGAASLDPSGSAATSLTALSTLTASSTAMMHKAA